jgi:chromosomal replication initiation ATPase DnaA
VVCFEYGVTENELVEPGMKRGLAEVRAVPALLVQNQENQLLTELAKRLHRDLSALSRAVARIRQSLIEDPRLDEWLSFLRMKC